VIINKTSTLPFRKQQTDTGKEKKSTMARDRRIFVTWPEECDGGRKGLFTLICSSLSW